MPSPFTLMSRSVLMMYVHITKKLNQRNSESRFRRESSSFDFEPRWIAQFFTSWFSLLLLFFFLLLRFCFLLDIYKYIVYMFALCDGCAVAPCKCSRISWNTVAYKCISLIFKGKDRTKQKTNQKNKNRFNQGGAHVNNALQQANSRERPIENVNVYISYMTAVFHLV